MQDPNHPIWKTLAGDERNRLELWKLLHLNGLLAPMEKVSSLFDSIQEAVQRVLAGRGANPFVRDADSGQEIAWDFLLEVYMAQSAAAQFLHAAGHLLRGHSFEIFGHARTMIESAGVAYLVRKEPDLADAYIDIDRRHEYKRRTGSDRILPKADPLTAGLNEQFAIASRTFHSNFVAISGRVQAQFTDTTPGTFVFQNAMKFHDIDPYKPDLFLAHSCWLVATSAKVLQLFARVFGLEADPWSREVSQLEVAVSAVYSHLRPLVFADVDDA